MRKARIIAVTIVLVLLSGLTSYGCAAPGQTPAATPTPQTPEVIHWKLQAHTVPGMTYHLAVTRFAERVEQMSGGRLAIEVFPGGAIVPATQELQEGVNKGVIDAGLCGHMYQLNLFPAAGLFYQVPGGLTALQMQLWYLAGGGTELAREMYSALENAYYVSELFIHPPEIWCHSTKPLKTLNDIKGLKIRAAGDAGKILARMGASVVMLPGGEIYEAAARGVIDAFEYGGPANNWDQGFQEVADYLYLSPTRGPTGANAIFVNKARWEELTPDIQLIVTMAAQAEIEQFFADELVRDDAALLKFIEYGTKVEPLPKEIEDAFIEEAKKFYDEQAAGKPFFKKVLESQRRFQEICERAGVR